MSEINTIDLLGDNVAASKLIDKSIDEFVDDTITSIGSNAFIYCTHLVRVSFPAVTSIAGASFRYCSALTTVILGNTSQVATLASITAFMDCPKSLYFYVPDALVDSYKAATNWSSFASKIKGLSELPA